MKGRARPREAIRTALVTGGAGFIGSHIAEALASRGYRVVVVDDLSSGRITNIPPGVRFVQAEIVTSELDGLFAEERFELVVHAAGQTSVARSVADPEDDRRINVEGSARLGRLAREYAVRRFVFFSSGGAIYGETPTAADEATPPAPLSPYGQHKLEAEQALEALGLRPAIVRPSNVYGPRQCEDLEGGVVSIFLNRALRGDSIELHGDGTQVRDFVHVDDVVAAVLALAESDLHGAWNVSTGRPSSVRSLVDEVSRVTGIRPSVVTTERRAGDVGRSCLDSTALQRATGWALRHDLASGIRQMMAELLRHA